MLPMEWKVEFGGTDAPDEVTVTLTGTASVGGFAAYNNQMLSDPRFHRSMRVLVDASGLDTAPMSDPAILEAISREILGRDWAHPPRAVAVVAADEESAKRQRLIRAHLGGSTSRREVFLSRDEAVAWLADQNR